MSFNGSGLFLINSSGQPVVDNTIIDATVFNALTADLAVGLSNVICKDGQTTLTANIPMGGFKLTGLAAGTTDGDSLRYQQRSQLKIGTFSRDISVTGTQNVTCIGFQPTGVLLLCSSSNAGAGSVGIDDGTNHYSVANANAAVAGTWIRSNTLSIYIIQGASTIGEGVVSSFGAGQFTVTWTKTGSPSGTFDVFYLAFLSA